MYEAEERIIIRIEAFLFPNYGTVPLTFLYVCLEVMEFAKFLIGTSVLFLNFSKVEAKLQNDIEFKLRQAASPASVWATNTSGSVLS